MPQPPHPFLRKKQVRFACRNVLPLPFDGSSQLVSETFGRCGLGEKGETQLGPERLSFLYLPTRSLPTGTSWFTKSFTFNFEADGMAALLHSGVILLSDWIPQAVGKVIRKVAELM